MRLVQEAGSVIYPTAVFASDVIVTKLADYFTADDLYIDCSRMAVGTGSIIKIGEVAGGTDHSDHAVINRCKLYNAPKSAILVTANSNAAWITNNRVQSCWSSPCSNDHGIWLQSSSDHKLHGNQVGGFIGSGKGAITVQACAVVEVIGNEVFSSHIGIFVYDSRDVTINSNFLQHFANHGMWIYIDATPTPPYNNIIAQGNRVTGCSSNGVSGGVVNTADSINVFVGSGHTLKSLVIQNNILSDDLITTEGHTTLSQRYSINLSTTGATLKNCMISGNVCTYNQTGGTTGAILPTGAVTGVTFSNNIGREVANSV